MPSRGLSFRRDMTVRLFTHFSRADSANRGWAISFVTLASVVLADASFDFVFLAITHHDIGHEAIQSGLGHNPGPRARDHLPPFSSGVSIR